MLQISVVVSRLRRCYDSFSTRFDNLFASFQCPSSCCCCCPCANKEIHSLITPFPHSTSLCPIRLLFIELKKRRNDGWSESDSELVVTKIMNDQSHGTFLYARKAIFDTRWIRNLPSEALRIFQLLLSIKDKSSSTFLLLR